jgi:hypothetical protein
MSDDQPDGGSPSTTAEKSATEKDSTAESRPLVQYRMDGFRERAQKMYSQVLDELCRPEPFDIHKAVEALVLTGRTIDQLEVDALARHAELEREKPRSWGISAAGRIY